VVVIIGILAAIAIPRFGETRERAYVSAMQSDLNQLRTAMEMYYQDNEFEYTGAGLDDVGIEGDDTGFTAGVTLAITAADATSWTATANHASTDWSCSYDSEVGVIECEDAD